MSELAFFFGAVMQPAFWIALPILGALCGLCYWMRMRIGRASAFLASVGLWIGLVIWAQASYKNDFTDLRYWIHNGLTIGATIGPVLLFPLIAPERINRSWLFAGGVACTVLGAFLFPYVAVMTVCALGIDCF